MEQLGSRLGLSRPLVLAVAWCVLLFLVLPILVVFPVSVTDQRYLSLPQDTISFRHFQKLAGSSDWLGSIWHSITIAVMSTVVCVTLGTLCAVGCWRLASRSSEWVRSFMLLPLVVPSIIYAIGVYRLFVDLSLLDSFIGVALTHIVTGLPYVVITVSASLATFDPRLEQAARNLGASLWQTVRWIIVPNIMPGVLSGAIFAFIHSWDETVIVLFVAGRSVYTLPRRMWNDINENLDPIIAACAVGLIFVTLIMLLAELALRARRQRGTT